MHLTRKSLSYSLGEAGAAASASPIMRCSRDTPAILLAVCLVLSACGRAPAMSDARPEPAAVAPGGADRAAWGRVLGEFVRDGGVDYASLAARPRDLERYLASLAAVDPEALTPDEALAFWSNAYNAVTLRHVLDRYPEIESVNEVDGFFDRLTYPVAGADRTLDEIETLGRDLGDPRVHFSVVCASASCPDLLDEPYRGEVIDDQLERQTRRFLSDPGKGMRYEAASGTLWLSSIFKWYAGDFTGGSTVVAYFARSGVAGWVLGRLPEEFRERIGESPRVRYLEYDWSLNDRPGR